MQQPKRIPNEQLAQAALMFIERTQISAQEAESMVLVKNWLRGQTAQQQNDGGDGGGERLPATPTPLRAVGTAGDLDGEKAAG